MTARNLRFEDRAEEQGRIDMPELISALSFALDMTEGALPGHALRSCVLGMRIGQRMGLAPGQLSDLYYALLLKDIGCSSNAAHMDQIVRGENEAAQAEVRAVVQAQVWADIRAEMKAALDLADTSKPQVGKLSNLRFLWKPSRPEEKPTERYRALVGCHRCETAKLSKFTATAAQASSARSAWPRNRGGGARSGRALGRYRLPGRCAVSRSRYWHESQPWRSI